MKLMSSHISMLSEPIVAKWFKIKGPQRNWRHLRWRMMSEIFAIHLGLFSRHSLEGGGQIAIPLRQFFLSLASREEPLYYKWWLVASHSSPFVHLRILFSSWFRGLLCTRQFNQLSHCGISLHLHSLLFSILFRGLHFWNRPDTCLRIASHLQFPQNACQRHVKGVSLNHTDIRKRISEAKRFWSELWLIAQSEATENMPIKNGAVKLVHINPTQPRHVILCDRVMRYYRRLAFDNILPCSWFYRRACEKWTLARKLSWCQSV